MKRIFYITLLIAVFTSCQKEKSIEPYYFDEPITDWSLTKHEVMELESLEFLGESSDYDTLRFIDMYGVVGDGDISFFGVSPISQVSYGFFSINKNLVISWISFENMSNFNGVLVSIEEKYGKDYEFTENEYNKVFKWEKELKNIELVTFEKQNSFMVEYTDPTFD